MAEDESVTNNNEGHYDFTSLLSSGSRDYLVRNTGEEVKIDELKGKKLGIYFSRSSCPFCQQFTPYLVAVYNELSSKGDFEVLLVSDDEDADEHRRYFAKMPWLSIPFSDSEKRGDLGELFGVQGIPYLVILDENGGVLTAEGVAIIKKFGAEGYPFTPERIKEMEEAALRSILVSSLRDSVISNNGKKVPVSELEGKMVCLYFFSPSDGTCLEFTPKLLEFYNKLKDMGESIEIVTIGLPGDGEDEDEDGDENEEELFKEMAMNMPWYALPWRDEKSMALAEYFVVGTLPALVIVGPDRKIATSNAVEDIEDYGILAYPFTPEKLAELAEKEKAMWPQKVKHPLHNEHELVLTSWSYYGCDGCMEIGSRWAFYCEQCDFHLHPKCALGKELEKKDEEGGGGANMNKLVMFLQSLLQTLVAMFKKLLRF